MTNADFCVMRALLRNGSICDKAARMLEEFAEGEGHYVWIETEEGNTIMFKKGWKIRTAEMIVRD